MIKIKFNSAEEMVAWLMKNEGKKISDNYGRSWKYSGYTFWFQDISENELSPGFFGFHLFSTDLYHEL